MGKKKFFIFGVLTVLLVSALLIFTGCPSSESIGHIAKYIYMTDTSSGNVYTYDFNTYKASTTPVVSIGENSSDRIYFFENKGFICTGNNPFSPNSPGIYTFDPNELNPTIEIFTNSSNLSPQYIAFINSSTAYVTSYDSSKSKLIGVFKFNPSNIDSSFTLIEGTDGSAQDIKLINGYLYVASYGNNSILKIDPSNNNVESFTLKDADQNDLLIHPSYITVNSDSTKIYFTNSG